MNSSRRDFIKKSTFAAASVSLASYPLFAFLKNKEQLAIQLYSVRDDMKKNPIETLRQLAAIGYKNVEHANYINRKFYGYPAKEFKKILNDLGLKMPSGHTAFNKEHWINSTKDFSDSWKYTLEDAVTAGQQYVITPSFELKDYPTEDAVKQLLEVYNKCGEFCKKTGLKFGYHNHHVEFNTKFNGKTLYELILDNTDRNLVAQQFDTGNLFNGGATAMDIIKKYPNRFELMHVKDEIKIAGVIESFDSTILGKGIVQLKEVVDLGKSGGVKLFVIEQEAYQGKAPLACVKEDFEIMKSWGY